MPDQYYSAIQSLVCIFSMQKCYSKQKTICFILVDFLEQNYFNNIVPVTSIDVFYRKYYVVTLNNLADAYFSSNEYSEALTVCEKAINQCFTLDTNYAIFALLKLKVEILYNLNELTESKKTYNEFSVFCQIAKYHTYFENSTNKFKKIYPELFLNYVEK